jgi:hypothetical protein
MMKYKNKTNSEHIESSFNGLKGEEDEQNLRTEET